MNPHAIWPPQVVTSFPLFFPLWPAISRLQASAFPDLPDWNRALLEQAPILVASGKPLRFVPQETGKLGFETQYEPRCYLQGEVQTRQDNWHDCFNALAWLTFPLSKAAINYRHYQSLSASEINTEGKSGSERGKVRDAVTLLDESGVIVACSDPELLELLQQFEWKKLFWLKRERVLASMQFYVIGHGLYEKSMQPYLGMTGQGLLLKVDPAFFTLQLSARLQQLDHRVADYVKVPSHCNSTREWQPVPLLGYPGWSEQNRLEAYYDNTAYFRSSRRASKG